VLGSEDAQQQQQQPPDDFRRHRASHQQRHGTINRNNNSKRHGSSLYGAPTFHPVHLNFGNLRLFANQEKQPETPGRVTDTNIDSSNETQATLPEDPGNNNITNTGRTEDSILKRQRMMERIKQSTVNHSFTGLEGLQDIHHHKPEDSQPPLKEDEWILGMPVPGREGVIGDLRNFCGAFVNSYPVSMMVAFLIIVNALVLGVTTFDLDRDVKLALQTFDKVLLSIFTAEFACQILYLGLAFFQNGWLIWDSMIVVLSWIFISSTTDALHSLLVFRLYAVMTRLPSMRNLIISLGTVVPRMATIWSALLIFFYTFCVLYTSLYKGLEVCALGENEQGCLSYDYFGRLDRTFLTLFQLMTVDTWTSVVRQVIDERPWALIGFIAFVIVTSFVVLNLFVAVICESLIEFSQLENSRQTKHLVMENQVMTDLQTEDLLQETRQVAQIQQEMIKNQLDLEKSLTELLVKLRKKRNSKAAAASSN
jgi:hypothetical protein